MTTEKDEESMRRKFEAAAIMAFVLETSSKFVRYNGNLLLAELMECAAKRWKASNEIETGGEK